jgi:hypothetical protein
MVIRAIAWPGPGIRSDIVFRFFVEHIGIRPSIVLVDVGSTIAIWISQSVVRAVQKAMFLLPSVWEPVIVCVVQKWVLGVVNTVMIGIGTTSGRGSRISPLGWTSVFRVRPSITILIRAATACSAV